MTRESHPIHHTCRASDECYENKDCTNENRCRFPLVQSRSPENNLNAKNQRLSMLDIRGSYYTHSHNSDTLLVNTNISTKVILINW